ncbi:MAG: ribosome silencing factor [Spirochaetaceae bacterium]|jgi:ribosome-associated protein|nr:ribosome silencing factor [Spirochaetaceae bacterium]
MDDTHKVDTNNEAVAGKGIAANAAAEQALALELGKLLDEHKGGDVVVIDLRPLSMWTDFFVIATAASSAHLSGLQRQIKEFATKNKLSILHGQKKAAQGDGWDVCDLGFVVVHIMTETSRSFYELENLWSGGVRLAL